MRERKSRTFMSRLPSLILTEPDFRKLSALARSMDTPAAQQLEEEITRALVVPQASVPTDVVTMNSRVTFEDLSTGRKTEVTVVYPHEADIEQGKVSILAPMGAALIGLQVGQTINWTLPSGAVRQIRLLSISYQPEAAGDWHL